MAQEKINPITPLLPLRDVVVYPQLVIPLFVGRDKSIKAIEKANNGEEALQKLQYKDNLPDIILLDLNMPKINGVDFLKILKSDENLKYIPIIIVTTSSNQRDLLECYKIGIAGYVSKPLKYEEYVSKIDKLLAYWSINELIKT